MPEKELVGTSGNSAVTPSSVLNGTVRRLWKDFVISDQYAVYISKIPRRNPQWRATIVHVSGVEWTGVGDTQDFACSQASYQADQAVTPTGRTDGNA